MSDQRFQNIVTSESELRAVIGHPNERVIKKEIAHLDRHSKAFIERSPFLLIASGDANGTLDVSPKGDPAGFVRVLDDTTLAIPDRLGNRRADTLLNILRNAYVGLLFLVPGKQETLRVNGRAVIVRDESVRLPMAVNGKLPDFAIVVSVEQVFMHCAKCVIRSHLWEPGKWPEQRDLASLAQALVDQAGLSESVEEVHAMIENDKVTRLY
jgi:PPOX class probable FMN-dependent enzyme